MRIRMIAALIVAATPALLGQRGAPASAPTPRLADGTPNLGRVPGERGVWGVPWIRNMGLRIDRTDGGSDLPSVGGAVGLVGHDLTRDGSRFEPLVPFMRWSAAVYDYHVANESKYDPEGYCLPPGGPRMMATPYPMEIIQLADERRIIMTFEGATHIRREIYLDGRAHPQGDALNPKTRSQCAHGRAPSRGLQDVKWASGGNGVIPCPSVAYSRRPLQLATLMMPVRQL